MKPLTEKGVFQIEITSACDLRNCSDCTRLLTHYDRVNMSVDNFKRAVASMEGYTGVIGVFGGNPCISKDFETISRVFAQMVPNKAQRGLWTNNFNGHGAMIKETYGYLNLNVHDNEKNAAEMEKAGTGWPIWGRQKKSWHSPVMVAVKDVIKDEAEQWRLIEDCDVNKSWSGICVQSRDGGVKGYFCEIASSFAHMYGDYSDGIDVYPGWWKLPITGPEFQAQINKRCTGCGIPLKLKGHLDLDFIDDVSATHQARVELTFSAKNKGRKLAMYTGGQEHVTSPTDYQRIRS